MNWSNFPETTPKESGYCYTYYYNKTVDKHLYKGLFWDANNKVWIFPTYEFTVEKFLEETKSKFYSECLSKLPYKNPK